MAFGLRKKTKNKDADQASVPEFVESRLESDDSAERPQKKKKKKNKRGSLSDLLADYTVAPALKTILNNKPFMLDANRGVVMILDTKDIGGITTKQRDNETTGQILASINDSSGGFDIYTAGEMLENDEIAFIPTEGTLDTMDEYDILRKATYTIGVADTSDNLTDYIEFERLGNITFAQAIDVQDGDLDIATLVSTLDDDDQSPESEDTDVFAASSGSVREGSTEAENAPLESFDVSDDQWGSADSSDVPNVDDLGLEPEIDEGFDFNSEMNEPIEEPFDEDDEELSSESSTDVVPVEDGWSSDIEESDSVEHVEDDRVIDADAVSAAMVQTFKGTGVSLDLDMSPFMSRFEVFRDTVDIEPGNEDTSEYFGQRIAALSQQYNTRLNNERVNNSAELIQTYQSRVADELAAILKRTSLNRDADGTPSMFSPLVEIAESTREQALSNLSDTVQRRQVELKKRFDQETEEAGESAKQSAMVRYRENYKPRFDRDLANLEPTLRQGINDSFDQQYRQIQERAQDAAEELSSLAVERILAELSEQYRSHIDDENNVLFEGIESIESFVRDNTERDFARSETIAKQLAHNNDLAQTEQAHSAELERVRQEHNSLIERKNADYDAVVQKYTTEIEAIRERIEKDALDAAEREKEALRRESKAIKREKKLSESLAHQEEVKALAVKEAREMEQSHHKSEIERLRADSDNRVAGLKDDVERYRDQIDRLQKETERPRFNGMEIAFIVLMFIAVAVAFFFVGGNIL